MKRKEKTDMSATLVKRNEKTEKSKENCKTYEKVGNPQSLVWKMQINGDDGCVITQSSDLINSHIYGPRVHIAQDLWTHKFL